MECQRARLNSPALRHQLPPAWNWRIDIPRPQFSVWLGDAWQIANSLTLNYGVPLTTWTTEQMGDPPGGSTEYSIPISNGKDSWRFRLPRGSIRDLNNVARGFGFTYNVGGNNDFVIGAATGVFYASHVSNITNNHQLYNQLCRRVVRKLTISQVFATNPTRGITSRPSCPAPLRSRRQAEKIILDPAFKIGYTWQSSIGFQN